MKYGITASLLLLLVLPLASGAQTSPAKGADRATGMRLFNQSCRVCHVAGEGGGAQYAPKLSKATLGGNEAGLRAIITKGTERMPGFASTFTPAEIAAIAAYVKSLD